MGVASGTATERLRAHMEDVLDLYVEEQGPDYVTTCVAHDDTNPSLAFQQKGDRCVINCRTGCEFPDLVRALEIPRGFLLDSWTPEPVPEKPAAQNVDDFMPCGHPRERDYRYHDTDGTVAYVKSRCTQKATCRRGGFYLWHTDEDGEVVGGIGDQDRILYRQVELLQAIRAGHTIYFVEGEKDADNGWAQAMPATTLFDGAKKDAANWRPEYTALLAGADVVIISDRDPVGQSFARGVAAQLEGHARRVRLTQVHPSIDKKKADLTDHLDAGYGPDDLVELAGGQTALFAVVDQEPTEPDHEEPEEEPEPDDDPPAAGALEVPAAGAPVPPAEAVAILDDIVSAGDDGGAALIAGAWRLGALMATHPEWRNWSAGVLVRAGLAAGLERDLAVHAARAGFTAGTNRPMIKAAA